MLTNDLSFGRWHCFSRVYNEIDVLRFRRWRISDVTDFGRRAKMVCATRSVRGRETKGGHEVVGAEIDVRVRAHAHHAVTYVYNVYDARGRVINGKEAFYSARRGPGQK